MERKRERERRQAGSPGQQDADSEAKKETGFCFLLELPKRPGGARDGASIASSSRVLWPRFLSLSTAYAGLVGSGSGGWSKKKSQAHSLVAQMSIVFVFFEKTTLTKHILKNINIYDT